MFEYLLKAGATPTEDFIKETFEKLIMHPGWGPIAALLPQP
jgi:hypothetical protein